MSYLDWHVGMKVVCVDPRCCLGHTRGFFGFFKRRISVAPRNLMKGRVYTVSKIVVGESVITGAQEVGVLLVEAKPSTGFYPARCFRPVQTRKTDISIFTAMLHDRRQKVPA